MYVMGVERVLLFGISLFARTYSSFHSPTTSPEILTNRYVSAKRTGYIKGAFLTFFSFRFCAVFLIEITRRFCTISLIF
jgi:hypothetical protein